ncbi:MAG: bifunctional aspartate kinase/homoserine dehydrogenase I [Woeseiaceae bacterium]|nr:bifunctional aspartate kinase/homoserine dehydrogenase I [Woeseiaceae bacterium]
MAQARFSIHKFGGSSLADAACFRRVAGILLGLKEDRVGVVVSAMGGMTDALFNLSMLAERNDAAFEQELAVIGERYSDTANELLEAGTRVDVLDAWRTDADDILDLLRAIALVRSAPQRSRDVIAGYGEVWSARLLAALLGQLSPEHGGTWVDARRVITVSQTELGPSVIWDASQAKFDDEVDPEFAGIAAITGFIATDEEGLQTTLGRNGSDYSASIFAALSDAKDLTIWTDVEGVMSADPRQVPEARVIDELTYSEAMELAYFGAKVLHPQTLGPVVDRDIPVFIRSSLNPAHPGSRIGPEASNGHSIKGITAVGGMALVNLEGSGMIGVPGTADRLFASLKEAGVSVTLISQASSEHSICIAVPDEVAEHAKQVIANEFAEELGSGQIQKVDVTPAQSIVAVVGDGMAGVPGIAARFFGTMGKASINIRAIAQGSSERNISAVIDSEQSVKALRAAHSGFYLSAKTVSIGLIGPGTVGKTFLEQLSRRKAQLLEDFNLDLRVRAIARSKTMLLGDREVGLDAWATEMADDAIALDFEQFEQHINPDHLPHAVIVDCTANDDVASRYAGWLANGIHVVTPNKKAFSGPIDYYRTMQVEAHKTSSHIFYETTVGAALPIISTLNDLVHTGDEIRSIDGIFSGTLAYLFNVYDGKTPFSEIVRNAKESGYTEPDPRDDLSGMDVARKLTILAREFRQDIEIGDFPVENLVPETLREGSIDDFLDKLSDYDDEILARFEAAQKKGCNLRYVARLTAGGEASVGLAEVKEDHPFSNINLTDNVVQFETSRYSANPLVVQGPGAGPEVTAAGVFADVLRLARYLDSDD